MLSQHATWPDGSNGVEAGLFEIRDLMLKGKWKFFAGQRDALDEFLQYHRDESGKIVKVGEDIMDGMRYAYMMRRYAVPFGEVGKPKNDIPVVIPKAAHFKRLR
jgi:hypothetical protein